jgi:hypothetical protein
MFQSIRRHLPERFFAAVFLVFSVVAGPGLFLSFFYGHYLSTSYLAWRIVLSAVIGLPVNFTLYFLYRILFKLDSGNDGNILPEIKILFRAIVSMFCGFAFVLPCAVKFVIPILCPLEGMLILVTVHFVGVTSAVIHCMREITMNRRRRK